mgnify:CR=1 FL=1
MRHNILPERVAEIVSVMRQSEQGFFELSSKEGTYCALGCIAEAYRRAFPHSCNWVTSSNLISFDIAGDRCRSKLPIEVLIWAAGDYHASIFIDRECISTLNDAKKYTLNEFADILEGKL